MHTTDNLKHLDRQTDCLTRRPSSIQPHTQFRQVRQTEPDRRYGVSGRLFRHLDRQTDSLEDQTDNTEGQNYL